MPKLDAIFKNSVSHLSILPSGSPCDQPVKTPFRNYYSSGIFAHNSL